MGEQGQRHPPQQQGDLGNWADPEQHSSSEELWLETSSAHTYTPLGENKTKQTPRKQQNPTLIPVQFFSVSPYQVRFCEETAQNLQPFVHAERTVSGPWFILGCKAASH